MAGRRTGPALAPAEVAAVLRERIYGGIACLSTLLVLLRHLDTDHGAWGALVDLAVSTGSLWAASLLADYVAHLTAHGHGPRGPEVTRVLRTSGQILEASVVPIALLVIAGAGLLPLGAAVRAGIWTSVVTLGLFALLAARRSGLPTWKRAALVVALVGLGTGVVAIKTLAHG